MAGHSGVLRRLIGFRMSTRTDSILYCQPLHQQVFSHDSDALVLPLLPFPAPTGVLLHVDRTSVECLTTSAISQCQSHQVGRYLPAASILVLTDTDTTLIVRIRF
jgi:hypothetical protein